MRESERPHRANQSLLPSARKRVGWSQATRDLMQGIDDEGCDSRTWSTLLKAILRSNKNILIAISCFFLVEIVRLGRDFTI